METLPPPMTEEPNTDSCVRFVSLTDLLAPMLIWIWALAFSFSAAVALAPSAASSMRLACTA
ncbi:hypothetical protein ACAE110713_29710 [Achromobacter aegrifaciens]